MEDDKSNIFATELWQKKEKVDIAQLCRACANPSDSLIAIFESEGIENDLSTKINKHLPIEVLKEDTLPTKLCYPCTSTLVSWHDMLVTCIEADKKLRSLISSVGDPIPAASDDDDDRCADDSFMDFMDDNNDDDSNDEEKDFTPDNKFVPDALASTSKLLATKQNDNSGIMSFDVIQDEIGPDTDPITSSKLFESDPVATTSSASDNLTVLTGEPDDERSSPLTKTGCEKIYVSEKWCDSTDTDAQTDLNNENALFCIHCGRLFRSKCELVEHLESDHSELRKIIECEDCEAYFSSVNELQAHLKNNFLESIYNFSANKHFCSVCLKSYVKKCELELHVKDEHLTSGFYCRKCDKNFTRYVCFEFHKLKRHKEHEQDFECTKCSKTFNSLVDLERHCGENNCEDEKQMFSCTLCDRKFTRKIDMMKHRYRAHTEDELANDPFEMAIKKTNSRKLQCNDCGKFYARKRDLLKHYQRKHLGEVFAGTKVKTIDHMSVELLKKAEMEVNGSIIYHCSVCGKNIITKRGYIRHVRIHTGERPFTCHICGKQYRSSTDLTRHLRCVHDGIKNYSCDICGKCFANKSTRNDHRRIHTGERPYICDVCGKAFSTPNSIYVHRRIHTDYFPHECTSCDKRFRRRQQLIHHVRTHTGEKPHTCEICGKSFGVKDELSRHRLTHSTEKPYVCNECGLCFGQKRYLKNHTKTHHNVIYLDIQN